MVESSRRCLDCGAELHGEFCSYCGQHNINLNVPAKELAKEFGEELFSFDERLLRSLRPFFFQPGFLTQEFIAGKRRRYISPFKLYFFMSFLFFFSITFFSDKNAASGQQIVLADSTLHTAGVDTLIHFKENNIVVTEGSDSLKIKSLLGERFTKGVKKLKENPEQFMDSLREHAPQLIFVLLPIFALILKLLYVRSNIYYITHIVFTFYFHAFIFLIFTVIMVLDHLGSKMLSDYSTVLVFGIPIHLFVGMRRTYQQSRGKTFLKFTLLGFAYGVIFWSVIATAVILLIVYL